MLEELHLHLTSSYARQCASSKQQPTMYMTPPTRRQSKQTGVLKKLILFMQVCNLVLVAGIVDPSQSDDREEKAQCEKVSTACWPACCWPWEASDASSHAAVRAGSSQAAQRAGTLLSKMVRL